MAICAMCGKKAESGLVVHSDCLEKVKALPKVTEEMQAIFHESGFRAYMGDILDAEQVMIYWQAEAILEQLKAIQEELQC